MIGIAVLAFFLCVLNFVFWLVFLKKFKSLFSYDSMIDSAKIEVSKIIQNLNRATAQNIDIIEGKIKELKAATAEADRHIHVAKTELEKQKQAQQLQNIISDASVIARNPSKQTNTNVSSKRAVSAYNRISDGLKSENSVEVTEKGENFSRENSLFSDEKADSSEKIVDSSMGTRFTMDSNGVSVASIAKLGENVVVVDEPVKPKKNMNEKIKELYNMGYPEDYIAKTLNITTTEVRFAIEFDS